MRDARLARREGRISSEMGKFPFESRNSFCTSMMTRALVEVIGGDAMIA